MCESSARCAKAGCASTCRAAGAASRSGAARRHSSLAAPTAALRADAPRLRHDPSRPDAPRRAHAAGADRERAHGDRRLGQAQAVGPSRVSARAAFSQLDDAPAALQEAWEMSGAQLERPPDLVALFCAEEHSEAAHDLSEAVADLAPDAAIIGACAADGVIGAGREQQGGAALALLAATLPPGARVTPFHALVGEGHEGPELVGLPSPPAGALAVALADPHSTPVEQLIDGPRGRALAGRLRRTRGPRRSAPLHERRLRRGRSRRHRARGPAARGHRLPGRAPDRPRARGHRRGAQPGARAGGSSRARARAAGGRGAAADGSARCWRTAC